MKAADKPRISVTVRIPANILEQVDSCLDREELPISRNHWIVNAVVEKIKRTKMEEKSNGSR
jgi:hypothetical protein